MKYEAILYDQRKTGDVRCRVCGLYCLIKEGESGLCRTRVNEGGRLYTLIYGAVSSICMDPIEKKPLYHFMPGTEILSLGSRGCNFKCPGCQNWEISHDRPREDGTNMSILSPEDAVALALEKNSIGIAFTYNDPSIWVEYTRDVGKILHEHGLSLIYITNGYSTIEHLDEIAPTLDAYKVDLKGFNNESYEKIAGWPKWKNILRTTEYVFHKLGKHVEIVTNLTPGINDDPGLLREMGEWIRDGLSPEVPWHITRFHPHLDLAHIPPTPTHVMRDSYGIAKKVGLFHVYLGNIEIEGTQDTVCPGCGEILIKRSIYHVLSVNIKKETSSCPRCGKKIYGVFRNAREQKHPHRVPLAI